MTKKVNVRMSTKTGPGLLHPMISEAVAILSEKFAEVILDDQECFQDEKGWQRLLKLLPDGGSSSLSVRRVH